MCYKAALLVAPAGSRHRPLMSLRSGRCAFELGLVGKTERGRRVSCVERLQRGMLGQARWSRTELAKAGQSTRSAHTELAAASRKRGKGWRGGGGGGGGRQKDGGHRGSGNAARLAREESGGGNTGTCSSKWRARVERREQEEARTFAVERRGLKRRKREQQPRARRSTNLSCCAANLNIHVRCARFHVWGVPVIYEITWKCPKATSVRHPTVKRQSPACAQVPPASPQGSRGQTMTVWMGDVSLSPDWLAAVMPIPPKASPGISMRPRPQKTEMWLFEGHLPPRFGQARFRADIVDSEFWHNRHGPRTLLQGPRSAK
ncbi:hypothetical protein B0I37DRAFT_354887 [Chaetomium sp. MPI-CAGE-AT-0009]|nr:hypothetical protein B0I37DRAFT_354887 [Chaetomium sp. MPI-CAGE-AT-0009]